MNKFFLTCPIGLERQLEIELKCKFKHYFSKSILTIIQIVPGGIEIECAKPEGLALNQILKTPSKILMRIKEQKCRDLPKFYNIVKKIPWRDYLNQEEAIVNITAKKSRIIHTGKLENSFHKAVNDYFEANKLKFQLVEKHATDPSQKVFIRLDNDDLTVSIDTSGELLHIRGDREFRGHASIRENIASLLLLQLMEGLADEAHNLIDPMCGTGTFLFEWKKRNSLQSRKFLYEYLNQKQLESITELIPPDQADKFSYYGFDNDPDLLKVVAGESDIIFKSQDVFNAPKFPGKNILIINPPYGKRVKICGDKIKYFKDLIQSVKTTYSPKRLGIIIPRDYIGNIKGKKTYFKQNGIDVCFIIQKEKI